MSGFGDPAIKLFGKTISLPNKDKISITYASATCRDDSVSVSIHKHQISSHNKDIALKDISSNQVFDQDVKKSSGLEVMKRAIGTATTHEDSSPESERNEEESTETSNSQEKTLKKPDIIIPCPRCNSMDTKFCYYNNYNVNQPRHFCKNCQRYWTAGGSMRNVPVGAGRRKHKQALPYRHIFHGPNLVHKNNGSLLNFGPDVPVCESGKIEVDLSSNCNSTKSGLQTNSPPSQEQQMVMNLQGFPLPVPYFPGPSWTPSLGPSGFPMSFCPTPTYWGYTVPEYNVPYIPTVNNNILTSGSNLGKHSRDAKENNSESGVWMPKTLRIDDPSEAAKSSIWETLGIKNDKTSSMNERGMFKTVKSKGNRGENRNGESLLMLHANPAAMSRSQNFHETT